MKFPKSFVGSWAQSLNISETESVGANISCAFVVRLQVFQYLMNIPIDKNTLLRYLIGHFNGKETAGIYIVKVVLRFKISGIMRNSIVFVIMAVVDSAVGYGGAKK